MKRKILFISLGVILLVIVLATGGFWYMSTQPLYQPGMAREMGASLTPPAQPADSATWLVETGIELTHFSAGEGRNVLIIHGGPGMPFLQPMSGLASLTNDFQFHYYDQRGCGESTRPIDRFESQNVYENMTRLDRTLGLGAQIADIERIRQILGDDQLILISPANMLVMPQPDAESDLFASVRAKLPKDQQAEFDEFMKEYMNFNTLFQKSDADLVAMNEEFGKYYVQVTDIPAQMPAQGRPGGWMVWAQYISMGQRHDYRAALKNVTAPVLIIHGADDLQSESASRMYEDAFPNAEFAVIEHAGHFSFEGQPDEFARIVGQFLAGVIKGD